MQEPWKTDKWYTSPWNHLPEVRKDFKFAKNIKIHDVTLRDGEQQTAVVFRREEKVAIARKLDAMGIHRIEAGMPAVSEQDKAAISDIANLGLKAEIFAFARCIPEEIKVVKACGCKGVVVEIPASDHMIKNAYGWSFERAMKSSIDTTIAAREAGLYTVFFTIDAGPHVKALCRAADADAVSAALRAVPGVIDCLIAAPGPGARVVEAP